MNTILALTLSGSALALVLLFIKAILGKRLSSTVYYYAWLLVMLRFLLPLPGMIPLGGEAQKPVSSVPAVRAAASSQTGIGTPAAAERDYSAFWAEVGQETARETAPLQQNATNRASAFNWRSGKLWFGIWLA